jgi:hypothetical protein
MRWMIAVAWVAGSSSVAAQSVTSRTDSLLLTIAVQVVRGTADANAIWLNEWFSGDFMLIRPEGGVVAVYGGSWPARFGEPLSVHSMSETRRARVLAAGSGLPDRFSLVPINGKRLVAFPLLDSVYSLRDPVLATVAAVYHEAFHVYQLDNRWFYSIPQEADNTPPRTLINSREFQDLAAQERALLVRALSVNEPDSLRALLRTYLEIRSTRTQMFPANVSAYEAHEERKEASAQMVGYRAGLLAVEGGTDRLTTIVRADLESTPPFELDYGSGGAFRHWHIYATGSAIAILLERLGVPWMEELEAGATFVDVLSRVVPPGDGGSCPAGS